MLSSPGIASIPIFRSQASSVLKVAIDEEDDLYLASTLLPRRSLLDTMESPIKDRVVVDIGKTVEKHQNIIPQILAAHALSGCDTVACCFGIGKNAVLKVVRSGNSLSLLGYIDEPLPAVIEQATLFMTACYAQNMIQCQMLD